MAHVALSGANGFLGWHTRLALREQGLDGVAVPVGQGFTLDQAVKSLDGSSRAIHLAGVNRASETEVAEGNAEFANQFAAALRATTQPPPLVVYANSIQASGNSVYGRAKRQASEILASAARDVGADYVDVALPNLFGEHGRPFYNAVTATFCYLLAQGEQPVVEQDRELTLLHAQNAADLLIGATPLEAQDTLEARESVTGLLERLKSVAAVYGVGEIPDIASPFDRDLFNTYRSYTFESLTPISLQRHADARGAFFEIVRSRGGQGQSSFSTTVPGVTRGDHFHRRKVERFTVLAGKATISLRRVFTTRVFDFHVTGDAPVAVDMPTGWAHNITNTGDDLLYTSFWTDDIFDATRPDTIPEAV